MKKMDITNETELILLSSRLSIPRDNELKIRKLLSGSLNWDEIIKISTRHETLGLVYYNLNKLGFQNIIPEPIFLTMKNYYYANLKRNLIFEKELFNVLSLANQDKIDIIPFKGLSLIHNVYHDPGLRVMVDIDVLLKEDELVKIGHILHKLGYQDNFQKAHLHKQPFEVVFTKKLSLNMPIIIEAHRALSPERPYKIDLPYLWQRARKEIIEGYEIRCLSPEDTLLSLALHLRRHTRRLTLKFIIDIAELINKTPSIDWIYIKESAGNNRFLTSIYISLYLAKELLEAAIGYESISKFRPNVIKKCLIHFTINRRNFFRLKKWNGIFLRLLLFDKVIDFIFYLWRVSFLERLMTRIRERKGDKIKK